MKKIVSLAVSAVLMSGLSLNAQSFEFDDTKLYAGGGLGYNSLDQSGFDSAIGYQFFGGYDLSGDIKLGDKLGMAAELGYASSGDFEVSGCNLGSFFCEFPAANGIWANAVFDYGINDKVEALGRIGLDLGDDDGLMFGFGAGYKIDDKLSVRGEYVIRQNYSSLQANVVYDF